MKEITVWIQPRTLEKMANKILAVSQKLRPSKTNPFVGLTLPACEALVWKNVEKAVSDYCLLKHANLNDPRLAFTFGAPLDDTVFMMTGCEFPGDTVPHQRFSVAHHEGLSETFTVDFYAYL